MDGRHPLQHPGSLSIGINAFKVSYRIVANASKVLQGVKTMLNTVSCSTALKATGFGLILAVLSGCAIFSPQKPEEIVAKRVEARWASWVKGDFADAYKYNTPAYRATIPLSKFETRRGKDVSVLSGEVYSVKCETADRCIARVKLTASAPALFARGGMGQLSTYGDETWLLEDGQWWYFEKI